MITSTQEPETKQADVVYFIEAVGLDRIKIGRSQDADARLESLRTGSPVPLRLLGVIPPGGKEGEIHRAFAASREHREWFASTPELMEFIAEHARPYQPTLPTHRGVPQPVWSECEPGEYHVPNEAIVATAALLLSVVEAQDEAEAREQGRATR
ncbi:MAG: GIY-YIG nuclease family protein [Planctomycetes bacterium]|nr:GIY-YIG nuclease family protein [Planctomycetota bacterium]